MLDFNHLICIKTESLFGGLNPSQTKPAQKFTTATNTHSNALTKAKTNMQIANRQNGK